MGQETGPVGEKLQGRVSLNKPRMLGWRQGVACLRKKRQGNARDLGEADWREGRHSTKYLEEQ